MKAVGFREPGPIDRDDALVDVTLDRPAPSGRDLLVEVKAVSVNPVDTKVRAGIAPIDVPVRVLGYDAAGTVAAVGDDVEGYRVGDDVFYAGSVVRQGTNAEFHLVDERIVGRKPASLTMAEAAALPLTAITAWEMLFDRLDVRRAVPGAANAVLVVGGAGGVGSIAIQILRAMTGLTVIATASRPETQAWVRELGAHHVVDHSNPLDAEVAALGIGAPAFVFSTNQTGKHAEAIAKLIAPQGRFGMIDRSGDIPLAAFMPKSVSIHWEYMFTRSMFQTADMAAQRALLDEVSGLVDSGRIRTTMTESLGPITAATLKAAHAKLESGTARGKIVLEGF
ncbi:zinc-binding alcohol dehydrogenase family protein [Amorphus sp. MBR-141]